MNKFKIKQRHFEDTFRCNKDFSLISETNTFPGNVENVDSTLIESPATKKSRGDQVRETFRFSDSLITRF